MILRSKRLNRDFELTDGKISVGRLPGCDIFIDNSLGDVSRLHLEIFVNGDHVQVRDEKSTHNTLLNGVEIRGRGWVELTPGDVIDIRGFDFYLVVHGASGIPGGASGILDGSRVVSDPQDDSRLGSPQSSFISLTKYQREESRYSSQLRALLKISATLKDVLKSEDVLERAVATLFEILPKIDRAAICYVDEQGAVDPKWWHVRENDPDSTIRISQNIGRHVVDNSEAIIMGDAQADFDGAKSVQAASMRSVMCCPMLDADEKVIGIIHVDSFRPDCFGELDLEILAAVTMQIALAINCSRLHAEAVADALFRQDAAQARSVQQRYLPSEPPTVEGYSLAGFYRAARSVGGDYFNYLPLANGSVAIILADVAGKGVPAALISVRLAVESDAALRLVTTSAEVLDLLNNKFTDCFITAVVLILNPATGEILLSSAGHEPPLVRRSAGIIEQVGAERGGLPLGVLENGEYVDTFLQLEPGDSIVIFSDGFSDAEHVATERRFGCDRLRESLGGLTGRAAEIVDGLVGEVDGFTEGSPQFDDMCMVCVQRTPDS